MLPFQLKSKKSMVRMGRLSGKQKELEKKYADSASTAAVDAELARLKEEMGL